MNDIELKKYLNGAPDDLVEASFFEMTEASWTSLFKWLEGRVVFLECQYGRIPSSELSLEKFILGEMSYIVHVKSISGFELSLSMIEKNEMTIDIEISEVSSENDSGKFISSIKEIAAVLHSTNHIICPEFDRQKTFYKNGEFV